MDFDELKTKIFSYIDEFKRVPEPVSDSSNLYFDLGFDSLSFMGLLVGIENAFGIVFEITEMEECLIAENLVRKVSGKL